MDTEDFGEEIQDDIDCMVDLKDGLYEAVQTSKWRPGKALREKGTVTNRYVFRKGITGDLVRRQKGSVRITMLASHYWCSPDPTDKGGNPDEDVSNMRSLPCTYRPITQADLPGFLWMVNIHPALDKEIKGA